MDEDELLYRQMSEEDPWYAGDNPDYDSDYDEYVYGNRSYDDDNPVDLGVAHRAYFLFWNPADSSYTLEQHARNFKDLHLCLPSQGMRFYWPVFVNIDDIHTGDKYYMIRTGDGPTGVVWHGVFTSEPYYDEDEMCYCVGIDCFDIKSANADPWLSFIELEGYTIYDWQNGQCGVYMETSHPEEIAEAILKRRFLPKPSKTLHRVSHTSSRNMQQSYLDTTTKNTLFLVCAFILVSVILWLLLC